MVDYCNRNDQHDGDNREEVIEKQEIEMGNGGRRSWEVSQMRTI